jgi:SAM-dependent methyltransferase
VLEHIPDDVAAMRELARVLRPGGTMAVTVPRCGPEAINWALSDEYHDTPGGHVRIYRRSSWSGGSLDRPAAHRLPPRPRPALALLVAALPGRPEQRHHPAVEAYHKVLVWDIVKAPS